MDDPLTSSQAGAGSRTLEEPADDRHASSDRHRGAGRSRADEPVDADGPEISPLELTAVVLDRWRVVAAIILTGVLTGLIVVFLLPVRYTGQVTLLPPKEQNAALGSILTASAQAPLGDLGAAILGSGTSRETFVAILESRSLADSIIGEFELAGAWEVETMHQARRILARRTSIGGERGQEIVVGYSDPSPERAAAVANAYPEYLNRINSRLSIYSAQRKREFLERRLAENAGELEASIQDLVEFQRTNETVQLDEQARQSIALAAGLESRIFQAELELNQLRRVATAEHPRVEALTSELAALREQRKRILRSSPAGGSDLLLSLSEVPDLGATYAALYRDVQKNERIYEFLTTALEQAKIEEANDTPVAQVLDPAVVPEVPSSPNRTFLMAVVSALSLALGLAVALVLEAGERLSETPRGTRVARQWGAFRREVAGIFGRSSGSART